MRRRKLLSLFLSLCLCLSLLPTAALAEDVQTEPLTEVSVTFPAPQAGDKIIEKIGEAAASGLTFSSTGHGLWKNGKITGLGPDAVYEEGSTYLLEFRFYQETPLTELAAVTCNGQPVTLLADDAALGTALREYNGTSDTYYAYTTVMDFSTGGTTIEDAGLLYLFAFVHIPKVLTTAEVATAEELTTALSGTNDIVKLTNDITIEARLDIARDVTVDLNGCVLRYDEEADPDSIFRVKSNCALTLTDSRPQAEHEDETLPAGGLITGGKGYRYDGGAGQTYYYYGGGVYVEPGASFVLAGGTIYACGVQSGANSAYGGGIYAEGGSVTMSGGAIRSCAVSADYGASGGAIYAKAGSVTMSGGVISGCSAKDGGGILTSGCTVRITGGRIENCKASGRGGGLYIGDHADQISVLDAAISGCEAKRGGGVALMGFAELELGENARITGCKATNGAAVYMDIGSTTYTVNHPGCFLYANGGRVEGTVYVGSNRFGSKNGYYNSVKAANAIDHTDGQPSTVFTGDVYCEGDIRGGSFYGSVTVSHDSLEDWGNFKNFWSNLSGGSFYGPVYTECHVSGGTYYAGLTLGKDAKLSGKPMDTDGVLNDETNIPDPNGKPVTVTYMYPTLEYPARETYAIQIVQKGDQAIPPTAPERIDLTFGEWYTNSSYEEKYDFDNAVEGDLTLYGSSVDTLYGIRITDKDGNAVYVTDKNASNVLGDGGTVVYVPGDWNEEEIPAEYWADDTHTTLTAEALEKLLADGEIPGIRLPRLTLNGADLQEIAVHAGWGADTQTQILNTFLQLELVGKNTISNSEERGAGIYCPLGLYLLVSGDGSLDITADCAISTEGGGFYQRGGEVTLLARHVGIAHSYSHYLQFYGGKLTIQVTSTESNNDYGALPFNGDDTFQIMDGATFRVGNSAEDNVLITLPSSDEFKPADIFDQWAEKVTTNKPYYLSLTANYTVTFDTDGGSEVASQTVPYGGQAAAPAVPAKPGYTFAGWYLDGKAYDFDAPVTENLTLTANWTVNRYTITFDTDGGSAIAPITQDYGTAVTAPADPTRTGYTFAGWTPEIPAAMPAENLTIKAKWTVNQYTITFDTDGGSAIAPITQDYGTAVTAPADPTRTGYTFAGWTPEIPATMPAEDLTIKAKWTVNQYTLTFDTDGGSAIAPITQDYGTAVTAPADPTRTGYTFAGWTPAIPETMPAENLTIKAKWTVNQYTITFDTDGGSAIAPITQDYGTAVTAPADPTRTGYTFAGWTPEIPAAMPAEDLTIKANWTVNTYTITYDLDGGTAEGNPASYTVESGAITLAEPAKPGYTFTGWSGTDLEGADNLDVTIPAGSTGDRSYTAHWQVNTVYSTLRFETRGGSALATLALPYGSRVDLTKYVPTREGFAFTGWYTDRELTQRVTSLTLTNSTVVYAGWNPFTDVGSGDWFYEDVLYVYNQGLMEGTGADTFSPDAAVTRGQVVTILWRMAGSPAVNFAMDFSDVTEDTWCAEAIRWAASEGIAQGFADGSFGQDVYVSREQLAAFLYREVQHQGGGFTGMWYFPLNYPDIEELGAFADEAMHWCVMTGVLQGTADGRLAPKATADRAQLSAILHRYLTVEK